MNFVVILLSNGVGLLLVCYLLIERKQNNLKLKKLNEQLLKKDAELAAQANDLKLLYERSKATHLSLQQEVNVRTANIDKQNRRLMECMYFHIYKLQVPLTKLTNAIALIRLETDNNCNENLMGILGTATGEMQSILNEFTHKVDVA